MVGSWLSGLKDCQYVMQLAEGALGGETLWVFAGRGDCLDLSPLIRCVMCVWLAFRADGASRMKTVRVT